MPVVVGPDFEGRLSASAGAALAAFLDLDDLLRRALLRRAVAYAADSAGTGISRILLHDRQSARVRRRAGTAASGDGIRGRRFPETGGIGAAVLTSGQAHIAPPRGVSGALMAAPLNAGDRFIGFVETMHRAAGEEFTSADLERFAGCCGLIAIALENASLYRRVGGDREILRRIPSQVRGS